MSHRLKEEVKLEIKRNCEKVRKLIFNNEGDAIHESQRVLAEQYSGLKLEGVQTGDTLFPSEGPVKGFLGAIVDPRNSNQTERKSEYNLNFYRLRSRQSAEMFLQFLFRDGEETQMISHGKLEDVVNLIRGHSLKEFGNEDGSKIPLIIRNNPGLAVISGSVFLFACGFFILKRRYSS